MLDVNAIDLHYGAAQALRAVSLKAEPGKVTCVLGRNGVGKTSLLDALAGQHSVTRGTITWEGHDITALRPPERARRGISYVPQGREIFPLLTVEENLRTGFAPLKREERTVPDDVFTLFPVLKDMLRRRGGDLSGGQQQQLAIGRALVMRPRLLLLDEPTEGIQPSIIKDIGRAITYLRGLGRIAIVLVEQYLDFARELGDHFAVMERGAIVYACDRDNLFAGNRAVGRLAFAVAAASGASRRARVHEAGSLRVRFPNADRGNALEAVIVNTAGGMAGGDRFAIDIEVGASAALTVTTAAAEKVYRSLGPDTSIDVKLEVGAGGALAWVPQETILFDQMRLARTIRVQPCP